jgi:hypothetical protein
MRGTQENYCAGAQGVLKKRFPVSGFLTISHRKDLLSPWLFIIADTGKYVIKGEIR